MTYTSITQTCLFIFNMHLIATQCTTSSWIAFNKVDLFWNKKIYFSLQEVVVFLHTRWTFSHVGTEITLQLSLL